MFNEAFIEYIDGNYKSHVSTFVHEVLHALYFHPKLFKNFPNNSNGESFLFKDNNGIHKM